MRRYFDNAATSYPKPPAVARAVQESFAGIHASAGRGAYREALEAGRVLDHCRAALRKLFSAAAADHVIFALNGTDALNLALKALLRSGDHAVTTCLDHNSVLRPLHALEEHAGITWTVVPVDPQTTQLDPAAVRAALRPNTRLVVVNHASNVTGVLQPIDAVGELCRARGVLFLVDAAQSAGHVPIDFALQPIDLLATPGHKGLLGPLWTGVLLIRAGVEDKMRTVREGGTGSESERPEQPEALPDRFESGSQNGPGIAGLHAGVEWLLARGVAEVRAHELELSQRFTDGLDRTQDVTCLGPRTAEQRVGVFSVCLDGLEPSELAGILESEFGILTRAGLHCAPLAHQRIGTLARGGTTRFSLGPFLDADDIDAATHALAEVARRGVACIQGLSPR